MYSVVYIKDKSNKSIKFSGIIFCLSNGLGSLDEMEQYGHLQNNMIKSETRSARKGSSEDKVNISPKFRTVICCVHVSCVTYMCCINSVLYSINATYN